MIFNDISWVNHRRILMSRWRCGHTVTLRGPQIPGPAGLRLLDQVEGGVTVPAGQVLEARLLHARHRVDSDRELRDAPVAPPPPTPPRGIPDRLPEGTSPFDFLEDLTQRVQQGDLSSRDALLRVPPTLADAVARPVFDLKGSKPISVGIGASPGCDRGVIVLSVDKAEACKAAGEPYVLVVQEVYGEEAGAVRGAQGLVSIRGGATSHAAVVAANSGVPCVIDETVHIDAEEGTVTVGNRTLHEGESLSLDGSSGAIYAGAVPW